METSTEAPLTLPSPRSKDKRQHDKHMAEVWVQYQTQRAAKSKAERQRRLDELRSGSEMRSGRRAQRAMLAVCPTEDLELFEKYGHKIRVPPIPYMPRRPAYGNDSQESSSTPGVPTSRFARHRPTAAMQDRRIGAATMGGQVKRKEELGKFSKVPNADVGSTLSPRKANLRQVQSDILKKTEVVFYKGCMRNHFRNILDAVEAKFTDADAKQRRVLLNISKPLTSSEIKHYMRHASAQNGLA
mmetsp:Transcript_20398/g.45730  ORF Transcript_20398/g.45730 Transcript_20398/m.45730 type:complete len:243 (+) Transcript_20398:51-779(+)